MGQEEFQSRYKGDPHSATHHTFTGDTNPQAHWRQEEFQSRYKGDPHSATHHTFTGDTNPQAHWRFGWTRSQCIIVAQLRTGHGTLLASYLHRIGRQQSPVCPYCGGDDETTQHLLLCCPSHASARTSTNYINSTDPRCMWSFLESIGAVTRPPPRPGMRKRKRERERERERNRCNNDHVNTSLAAACSAGHSHDVHIYLPLHPAQVLACVCLND